MQYWDVTATPAPKIVTCTLAAATRVDVGLSDVAVDTCTGAPPPSGIVDRSGPVEPMVFVVPKASQQTAITAEEAYFVFGFGAPGQAKPWIDPNFLMIRNPSSGTEQVIAHEIGMPAARWKGMDKGGSGGVVTGVSA